MGWVSTWFPVAVRSPRANREWRMCACEYKQHWCSSTTTNPVCERRVNLLVYSLSLHRHSYIGFILDFASSIHNKQHSDELLEFELLLVGDCGELSPDPLDVGLKKRSKKEDNIGIDDRRFTVFGIDDIEYRRLFTGLFDGELLSEKESQFLELFLPP